MVSSVQEFYGHFQELESPKRLLGFSKAGNRHYASPGERSLHLQTLAKPQHAWALHVPHPCNLMPYLMRCHLGKVVHFVKPVFRSC